MTPQPPVFIANDPAAILSEIVQTYEAIAGHVLPGGAVERLLLNAFAYREALVRQAIQDAGTQNLVAFSRAPALDYLAELVGVVRLASAPAVCTLEFTLVDGHTGVVIPENTRVASGDGQVYFATAETITVPAGELTAQVEAFAEPPGTAGNGYAAGEIKTILDPLPYLLTAANVATTTGGADTETDDQLRERIRLAPGSFSTAGSRGAYVFHTKTASTLIIDVAVTQPTPGTVEVFPLVAGGVVTSPSILALVVAALNDEKVRPLTDTVIVTAPTIVEYAIELELVIYTGADAVTTLADATAAVEAYKDAKAGRLGQDVTSDQLIAAALLPGRVYGVTVVEPAADLIVDPTEVAVCTGVTVTITSTTDG